MGFLSRFEGKMEDTFEGAADKMFDAPISPVQIAKKAEKQMRREKMVGAGKQFAPTLYTVLVNPDDDRRLFGYYPTLAGETETYLTAKASEQGLVMDGQPLVRFIVDDGLKHGKFDIIAEMVAAPIIAQLRAEEMDRYGLSSNTRSPYGAVGYGAPGAGNYNRQPQQYDAAGSDPYDPQPYDQAAYDPHPLDDDYGYQPQAEQPASYLPDDDMAYDEFSFSAAPAAEAGAVAGASGAAGAGAPQTMVFNQQQQPQAGPAAAAPLAAQLIDTTNNRAYDLSAGTVSIGRESRNNVVVPDLNASRMHAQLACDARGTWVLTDLQSTNGTLVNDADITTRPLRNGDRITIGTTDFVFTQK